MRRKLRKSLSWLLTVSMIFSLVFGAIPTASAAVNDTEFHIMDMDKIKEIVAKECNVNAADVTIHGIFVHGERNDGEPGTATGGVRVQTITNNRFASGAPGDEGFPGTNGILSGYDGWNVLNTVEVIKNDSVDSITIFARTGTRDVIAGPVDRLVGGTNLDPVTVYLGEGSLTVTEIDGKLVTEISLEGATTTPPEETQYSYTINYYYVDAEGTVTKSSTVDSHTASEIKGTVQYKEVEDLTDKPDGTYIFDAELSSDNFEWTQNNQVFEVYYALDANNNGTPDYQETPDITSFTKELVTGGAPEGVQVPEGIVVTYPEDGHAEVDVPVNSTVTLMYALTVGGKEGTDFTITESEEVTFISGGTLAEDKTTISGTIPAGQEEAVIYITTEFDVTDIDPETSTLGNTASIAVTGGNEDDVAEGAETDTETVPAE